MQFKWNKILFLILFTVYLSGCIGGESVQPVDNRTKAQKYRDKNGSFFTLNTIFSGKKKSHSTIAGNNIYLLRGALDTLKVKPLRKVDYNVGIIETEWVSVKERPYEQVRISALILPGVLNAAALRVNIYRRIKKDGVWVNVAVSKNLVNKVSDAILQRARELRILDKANQ